MPAKTSIQQAADRSARMQVLVDGQADRVSACEARGDMAGARREASLLAILRQCLDSARRVSAKTG